MCYDACVMLVVSVGTFVDCLGGQWWAHSLNLGYILPEDHVKSTVSSVFTGNHVDSFNPGMYTCPMQCLTSYILFINS